MKITRKITILAVLLAVCVAVVSICGSFVKKTYERETESLAAQGIGQDLVDLFLVVPLLLISLVFVRRGSRTAFFLFGGTVFYIMYSFVIYAFGVHFNYLFLLYCATLGLSLYLFIFYITEFSGESVESWFAERTPIRLTGIYLIVVALLFYLIWLKDLVPPILQGTIPASVAKDSLQVNPVHVIDISFALPGLIVTALLLMRKRRLGYILAPMLLIFIVILTIALAAMIVMLFSRGISEDPSLAVIFGVLAVFSTVLYLLFMKNRNKATETV